MKIAVTQSNRVFLKSRAYYFPLTAEDIRT